MRFGSRVTGIVSAAESASLGIAGLLVLLMMAVVGYAALQRYVLVGVLPTVSSDEYAAYLLVGTSWLAVAATFRQGRFAAVTGFVDRLPANARTLLRLAADTAAATFLAILTFQSARQSLFSLQTGARSEGAEVPLYLPQMLVPIGTAVCVLVLVHDVLRQGRQVLANSRENGGAQQLSRGDAEQVVGEVEG